MSFECAVPRLKRLFAPSGASAVALALILAPAPVLSQGAAPKQTLPLQARTKGAANAPVTVYEMADFQCPVCKIFVDSIWPTLQKEFIATGKVKWVYIMFPLPSIHANAVAAASFAACAATQGKFWQTHDMLYATQASWERLKDPAPFFQSKVAGLGLKAETMTNCLTSGAGSAMVQDDAAGSERAGARGTPTFYVEGGLIDRLYPLAVYQQILDSVWKAKTKPKG